MIVNGATVTDRIYDKKSKNPRMQCRVCGKWKRLTAKDGMQHFYPCTVPTCKLYGEGEICTTCCPIESDKKPCQP